MACGVPNIGPDFSSFTELIGNDEHIHKNRGLLSMISGYETLNNGIKKVHVSPKSTAENVITLHEDKMLMKELGNNAYKWSQQYIWNNISLNFDELLKNNLVIKHGI